MAIYATSPTVKPGFGAVFDSTYKAGSVCSHSGIYRCQTCGEELALSKGQPLPADHEAPHDGAVAWKLIVYAERHKH